MVTAEPERRSLLSPTVRALAPKDADRVVEMAAGLSAHEGAPPPPFDRGAYLQWGFGAGARFGGLVAEVGGHPIGYILYHQGFHVGRGAPGLFLMDLFVEAGFRGRGIGRALMAALARYAEAEGETWITWQVHPDNRGAMDFYRSVGARRYRAADFELDRFAIGDLARDGYR